MSGRLNFKKHVALAILIYLAAMSSLTYGLESENKFLFSPAIAAGDGIRIFRGEFTFEATLMQIESIAKIKVGSGVSVHQQSRFYDQSGLQVNDSGLGFLINFSITPSFFNGRFALKPQAIRYVNESNYFRRTDNTFLEEPQRRSYSSKVELHLNYTSSSSTNVKRKWGLFIGNHIDDKKTILSAKKQIESKGTFLVRTTENEPSEINLDRKQYVGLTFGIEL